MLIPAAQQRCLRRLVSLGLLIASAALAACNNAPTGLIVTTEAGVSPFISFVHVENLDVSAVTAVAYTIVPKPGAVSKPLHVTYSIAALAARGYISGRALILPVFGLYARYENLVTVQVARRAGTPISFDVLIPTPAYSDPSGIYGNPQIMTRRAAASALGFDFIFIKSGLGSPVVIDTDAQIRWAAPGIPGAALGAAGATSSILSGDTFVIGDGRQPTVYRLSLDGRLTQAQLSGSSVTDFHHNIDPGKNGVLAEVDSSSGGVTSVESTIIELDAVSAAIEHQWDLAAILSAYMSSRGDDAGAFVRPGADWFHSNSAVYDPRDDSIIVSSRENFVVKLDYSTGAIIWILGDPTKFWYTFPSLRAKALTLVPGGLYPIGQHAVSLTSDGLLLLFNNGLGSAPLPAGEPEGQTRAYSAVCAYSIDPGALTAQEVWRYNPGEAIFSSVCSSAYESADGSILVDYAVADSFTDARLIGLDSQHNVVFDFRYPTSGCETSWNARQVPWDDLQIAE